MQATNDSREIGYGGPCPPRGHGRHRYHFRLLALSVDRLPRVSKPLSVRRARGAQQHPIAEAILVGTYQRS